MESDMIVVIFLAEGEPVLIDVGMLNTLDDATVGEIGVALKHILMVDNQLIEYGRTIDTDRTAGDGAVRIELDVAILAYDSTLEELEQKAVGILHILADERSIGTRQSAARRLAMRHGGTGTAQEETEDGEPPAQLLDGSAARRLCGAACRLDVDQALDLLFEQRRAAWAGQEEAAIRRMTRTYLEGCRA